MLPRFLTGLILAGGRSHRMGRDKAFLDVDGVPMIRRVIDALRPACEDVLIVTKTPEVYEPLGVRVVADEHPDQAPLVGLCSGMRAASTPYAFATACDLPFLSPAVVRWMGNLAPGYDAVVPRVGGRWHPLHAVYAADALPVLDARREGGDRRLIDVLAAVRVREVREAELVALDPGLRTLRNVNTEADYRALTPR